MIEQNFLLIILLLLGVYISLRSYETYNKDYDEDDEDEEDYEEDYEENSKTSKTSKSFLCNSDKNINEHIQNAYSQYRKDLGKYNIGSKSYKYDFIDNEQPLNGLSPSYTNTYPGTLKKENKMIVDQDTYKGNYTNLLNTRNNSLKTYYKDDPKY
jgi:hypothetical protein